MSETTCIQCPKGVIDVSNISPCCLNVLKCLGIICLDDGFYCGFEKKVDGTIDRISCNDMTTCGGLNQTQCAPATGECNGCKQGLYNQGGICKQQCDDGYYPDNCNNCQKFANSCGGVGEPTCSGECNEGLLKYNGICVVACPAGYIPDINGNCIQNNRAPIAPSTYRGESVTYPFAGSTGYPLNDAPGWVLVNSFTDPDGDPITYTFDDLPVGLTWDSGNQKLVGNMPAPGTYTATVQACDDKGACSTTYPFIIYSY